MFDLMPWRRRQRHESMPAVRNSEEFFDRLMQDFLGSGEDLPGGSRWLPQLDVSEGRREVTVRADVPGLEPKDLDISLDGRRLTICGEKKHEKEEKEENFHRVERTYGSFRRTVELPAEVAPDHVEARYKNGVLKIRLKKSRASEARRITVQTG